MTATEIQAVETHIANLRRTHSGDINHGFYERRGRALQGRAINGFLQRLGSDLLRRGGGLLARFR